MFAEQRAGKQADKHPCGAAETWLSDRISSHRYGCGLHFPSCSKSLTSTCTASPGLTSQLIALAKQMTLWILCHTEPRHEQNGLHLLCEELVAIRSALRPWGQPMILLIWFDRA